MQAAGYEIKRSKYISFRAPEQRRFSRLKNIGEDYTEERIAKRMFYSNSKDMIGKDNPK